MRRAPCCNTRAQTRKVDIRCTEIISYCALLEVGTNQGTTCGTALGFKSERRMGAAQQDRPPSSEYRQRCLRWVHRRDDAAMALM